MLEAIGARLEGALGRDRVRRLHRASVAVIGAGLLGGQLLISKQKDRALLVGVANDGEALVVDGPGQIEAAHLGTQRGIEGMNGNCHEHTLSELPPGARED